MKHYLGLCAIAKDETPYLREWIAYHHSIGFERIFLYDNDSTVPIEETLQDYDALDIVELYKIPGKAKQMVAYQHCLNKHGKDCEWMAFFDIDEFLLLHLDKDARIFASRYEDYPAIALSSIRFGSSGHLGHAPGLVMERFTHSIGYDIDIKCIVKPAQVSVLITPHHFTYKNAGEAISTSGVSALGGYAPLCTNVAQINHYCVKSQEEYEKRLERGDAFYLNNPRSLSLFYQQSRLRGREERGILKHVEQVRDFMADPACKRSLETESPLLLLEPYPLSLERLNKAMNEGNTAFAHLVFSLSRRRFADKATFWMLGVKACLAEKDTIGSLEAAKHLIKLSSLAECYELLFEAQQLAGLLDDATHTAAFLLRVSESMEVKEKMRLWLAAMGLRPESAQQWSE